MFTQQTAIITGGASGIGRCLGAELFGQGAHVVLADVDGEAAIQAAQEISAGGAAETGSIIGTQVDVRESDAIRRLVDEVATRHGRLDLMFNNAGISMGGTTHEMGEAAWNRIIDVNLRGVVNGVLAAYPLMVRQGSGHIVNTASGAGLAAPAFTVAYATTKHAIVGLSTGLRPEAAHYGVRVSVLCPGAIDTPILDRGLPSDLSPGEQAFQFMSGREYLKKVGLPPAPADRFARRALHGVERNKAVITVGSAKALWYVHRISPALTERMARFTVWRILRS